MASSAKINTAPPSSPTLSITIIEDDHKDHDDKAKIKIDSIFETLGSFGKFQKIQLVLICAPIMFMSMHVLSWTFVVASARKTCTPALNNFTFNNCEEHAYSASDRWNMSGDNYWIRGTVQSLYFIGQMVGSFSCGVMADKIGRKTVLVICLITQVICAVMMIFAPTWWMYAFFKSGTGFTQPGLFGVAVVLGIELVGPKYRSRIAVTANFFCAIGGVILGVLAYFIVNYQYLHAAIAIPSLIFLIYWWIIFESARWLISKAEKRSKTEKTSSFNLYDLVRTPEMRKRTLTNFLYWPTTTMIYYGLTMRSDVGGGNLGTVLESRTEIKNRGPKKKSRTEIKNRGPKKKSRTDQEIEDRKKNRGPNKKARTEKKIEDRTRIEDRTFSNPGTRIPNRAFCELFIFYSIFLKFYAIFFHIILI